MKASRLIRALVLSVHELAPEGIGSRPSGPAVVPGHCEAAPVGAPPVAVPAGAPPAGVPAAGVPAADGGTSAAADAGADWAGALVRLPEGWALADEPTAALPPAEAEVAAVAVQPATETAAASIQPT
jgi:hypothetical protein